MTDGRLRGLKALIHDAVDFTVDRVEEGQAFAMRRARQVVGVVAPELSPLVDGVELVSSTVPLATARAVNRLVQLGTDPLLALRPPRERAPIAMRSDITGTEAWLEDAAIGALNGAVGDYLAREGNALDLGFSLRALGPPGGKVVVLVHGLGTTEWSWCWDAAAYHGDAALNFGTLLQRDLGLAPIFARYNTGRHVFENGRALAGALEDLLGVSGSADEIVLIGHSMGGLVVRSACHHGSREGHRWVPRVTASFSLAVPHQGAPLEKLGHLVTGVLGLIDHPGASIPREILRRRSAGIQDLRLGTLLDERWSEIPEDVPLLDHVAHHFVSATLTRDPDHPVGRLLGDVLVRVPSASGPRTSRSAFPISTERFGGILHHQLQNHPDIYAWIRGAVQRAVTERTR